MESNDFFASHSQLCNISLFFLAWVIGKRKNLESFVLELERLFAASRLF